METTATSKVQSIPKLSKSGERRLLDSVPHFLQAGLDIKNWWDEAFLKDDFEEKFKESFVFNRPDTSFGYFDHAVVTDKKMPIMGSYQSMLYDKPKSPKDSQAKQIDWMQEQIREFVLKYFMRISDFRKPQGFVESGEHNASKFLDPISMCPKNDPSTEGFGFNQLYYKKNGEDQAREFPKEEQSKILDLRVMQETYEWVLLWVDIFDFGFGYAPFPNGPEISLPLPTGSYLVMNPDYIIFDEKPKGDILARYGLGYSFVKKPNFSPLAYGPGEFEAAFESFEWEIHKDGKVRLNASFASNSPERILNLSLDPFSWGPALFDKTMETFGFEPPAFARQIREMSPLSGFRFDPFFASIRALNFATAGRSSKDLCISKKQILKDFLLKHFQQHYETFNGSLQTWRQVEDWTDKAKIPSWVKKGSSA